MTEEQWLACDDPTAMLCFVLGCNEPRVIDVPSFPNCRASDRKLRLFACACYRSIQHLLPNLPARRAVFRAEGYADGLGNPDWLKKSEVELQAMLDSMEGHWRASRGEEREKMTPIYEALALARQICRPEAPKAAYYAASNAYHTVAAIENPGAAPSDVRFGASQRKEQRAQAAMLRDMLGPGLFHPASMANDWRSTEVVALATHIYQHGSFELMTALGAALSDAGCTETGILEHCGGPGPHVKGCHVLDLLLNKT